MINSNNKEFTVTHESEVSYILSKYNQDFIYNTLTESLNNRIRAYEIKFPNIVSSIEESFQINKQEYNNLEAIENVRQDVYKQIIIQICNFYLLSYDDTNLIVSNLYTSALYMYEFFISSFQANITSFFVNYIMKERNSLYELLSLNERKKQKDASTIYNKKVAKNPKLAIICANLDYIVDTICTSFDITFNNYIDIIYGSNTQISKHLKSTLIPNIGNFFRRNIGSLFMGPFRSILLTSIRLQIQSIIISEESNIRQYVKEEE